MTTRVPFSDLPDPEQAHNKSSHTTNTTLHRTLARLVNDYPLADVIESLATIAFDNRLIKTSEILDTATDTALQEPRRSFTGIERYRD